MFYGQIKQKKTNIEFSGQTDQRYRGTLYHMLSMEGVASCTGAEFAASGSGAINNEERQNSS